MLSRSYDETFLLSSTPVLLWPLEFSGRKKVTSPFQIFSYSNPNIYLQLLALTSLNTLKELQKEMKKNCKNTIIAQRRVPSLKNYDTEHFLH